MRIYCHIIAIVCFVASAQSLERRKKERGFEMQARRRPVGGSDGKKREG